MKLNINLKNINMKEIFAGKTSHAEYDEGKRRIYFTFNGYANPEEHKAMYLKVLEFMKVNKTESFVTDLRKLKGTFTNLNDWIVETMRPAVDLGLKKSAMILNEDVFTAFAANDLLKKVKVIQLQVFKKVEEAEEWLT